MTETGNDRTGATPACQQAGFPLGRRVPNRPGNNACFRKGTKAWHPATARKNGTPDGSAGRRG